MTEDAKHWCIVDNGTKKVVNVIMWDGDTVNNPYNPGPSLSLIQSDVACMDWTYDFDTKIFSPPDVDPIS